jgi:Ca-activated chloride channel family protein
MPHVRLRAHAVAAALILAAPLVACGDRAAPLAPRTQTFAELRTVRRGVTVTAPGDKARAPYPRERLVDGQSVEVDEGGLAWLRRDGGATLLVQGPAKLTLGARSIALKRGKLFVDTPPNVTTELGTPSGPLQLAAVRASIDVGEGGQTRAYVLSGEVRAGREGRAGAGERLVLSGKPGATEAKTEPVVSWEDWTGGLATTDRSAEPAPFGLGTVGARSPGSTGEARFALAIQKLDVRVTIVEDLAITEVDETFFNSSSEVVEGLYRFRTPESAILQRFGVDREGAVVWGRVKEKQAAAAQYQANVYEGSREDPALLEWDAPGSYRARLYPIGPGEARRVVVRYAEWLGRTGDKGERRLYVYPMAAEGAEGSLPHIEDLTATLDVDRSGAKEIRTGMAGVRERGRVVVRAQDFIPRADLSVELFDDGLAQPRGFIAPHVVDTELLAPQDRGEALSRAKNEADYILVPIRAVDAPTVEPGIDLAIVVDTSAATDAPMLAIARASTKALLAHLGEHDRAVVWAGDDKLRAIVPGRDKLAPLDAEAQRDVLTRLVKVDRGGATDLGGLLASAAAALDPKRSGAVVYIGDGRPTVGELSLRELDERLAKLPRPVRIFGLGVGDGAEMATLQGLARGAFAERIGDESQAARAALRLFELAERPVALGASVDLGPLVTRVYPRDLGALAADETVMVVGRLKSGARPTELTVMSDVADTRREKRLGLSLTPIDDKGDLGRRWANGRLEQLLDEDVGRAALVDLGQRHGIITPYTSLYVPTTNEMTPVELAELQQQRARARTAEQAFRQTEKPKDDDGDEDDSSDKAWSPLSFLRKSDAPASAPMVVAASEAAPSRRAKGEQEEAREGGSGAPLPAMERAPGSARPAAPAAAKPAPARDMEEPSPGLEAAQAKTVDNSALAGWGADSAAPAGAAGLGLSGIGAGGGGKGDPLSVGLGAIGTIGHGSGSTAGFGSGTGANKAQLGGPARPRAPRVESDTKEIRLDDVRGIFATEVAIDVVPRVAARCSAGAGVPFDERVQLWRERLARIGANPHAAAAMYRAALWSCEAPTWRERSRLLSMLLDAMGDVTQRVALWRTMQGDLGAASVLYRGLIARVKTPEDTRALHAALGLTTIDPSVLAKLLDEATTPAARAKVLRGLVAVWPDDLALALRLLDALEDLGDDEAARELGRKLRTRPDADARVRTAVGELSLRLAARAKSPEDRARDEAEARRSFGEIVEFSPDDPVLRRRLGDLLRAHGFFAEATRQYETLARLVPDEPSTALLLAACAEGLDKLEEAVKWTEKAGSAGSPDAEQSPARTARAFAATYLAWGRLAAQEAGRKDEADAILARLDRVLAPDRVGGRIEGQAKQAARVALTWSHPELHPSLWTNALGAPMPAPEGDVTLGIAQAIMPERADAYAEVRLDPEDAAHAARLGATATLTVVFDEAGASERIVKRTVRFEKGAPPTQRFALVNAEVKP